MPFINADWTITRATGDIRYIGDDHNGVSPSYVTTIELHRALQDFADDAASVGDDELDITDPIPSARLGIDMIIELLNGFNIDDASSEHIYDGSIIQNDGDDIYDGLQNFGNANQIQIIQNGAILSDDWWNSNGGLNPDPVAGVSHRFMLKVRSGGVDIDNRRIIATQREFGTQYDEFIINGSTRGNNPLSLNANVDNFNTTLEATVATWVDVINNNEGYTGIDVSGDGSDEFYYSNWDIGIRSINDATERWKWLTRDGNSETLYGLSGEVFRGITHEFNYDNETGGPFTEPENISWSGGTGQLFAIDDNGTTGTIWMQLLTGVAPSDDDTITGGLSSATCQVNGSVTSRNISIPFFGSSTGIAIIGAYGFGIEVSDLTINDRLTDLTETINTPENLVQFLVNGTTAGVGNLLVGPWDGSTLDVQGNPEIDWDQMALFANQTGSSVTSLQMQATIPLDTPSSGTIRVTLNSGLRLRVDYSSYTGDTFTITSTDFSTDNADAGNGVVVTYIDRVPTATNEGFNSAYQSDRNLIILHRDGGVSLEKEVIVDSVLEISGGSITLVRASDE